MNTFNLVRYINDNLDEESTIDSDGTNELSSTQDDKAAVRPAGAPRPREQSGGRPDAIVRAIAWLATCDGAVSGRGGHDKLFHAAGVGPGFKLNESTTFQLLKQYYNHTCIPPWDDGEISHKVKDAFKTTRPHGWLLDADRNPEKAARARPPRSAAAEIELDAKIRAKIDEGGLAGLYRDDPLLIEIAAQPEAAIAVIKADLKSIKGFSANDFKAAIRDSRPKAERKTSASAAEPVYMEDAGIVMVDPNSDEMRVVPVTDYTARIICTVIHDDGDGNRSGLYKIKADLKTGETKFLDVPTNKYQSMGWAADLNGNSRIFPRHRANDYAADAIKYFSYPVPERIVYTHTGWAKIEGEWFYLSGGGAIGADGMEPSISVELQGNCASYSLPDPPEGGELVRAIRSSLRILDFIRSSRPRSAAAAALVLSLPYRAAIRPTLSAAQLIGRTGSFKSSLAALAQQHFGAGMHRNNLPLAWSASIPVVHAVRHALKDALVVIDDFRPVGSSTKRAMLDQLADDVFRSQGNGRGAQRAHRDGTQRKTPDPRGSLLSTGEEKASSSSANYRTLIANVVGDVPGQDSSNIPGTIDRATLTACQGDADAGLYAASMAGFVRWLAGRREAALGRLDADVARYLPIATQPGDHGRTPEIVADLAAGFDAFLAYAVDSLAITPDEAGTARSLVWHGLMEAGTDMRSDHAESKGPGERFLELAQAALNSGRAHLTDMNNGRPPYESEASCGWLRVDGHLGIGTEWQAGGSKIGWYEPGSSLGCDAVHFIPSASYKAAISMLMGTNETMSSSWEVNKQLDEMGKLHDKERDGEGGFRRTSRRSIGGRQIRVLTIKASDLWGELTDVETGTNVAIDQGGAY